MTNHLVVRVDNEPPTDCAVWLEYVVVQLNLTIKESNVSFPRFGMAAKMNSV